MQKILQTKLFFLSVFGLAFFLVSPLPTHGADVLYGFTKTVGGIANDYSYSVAIDGSGNIYQSGYFEATVDFDPSAGTDNHTSAGNADIFLSKYASDGTYQWTKTVGGTGFDTSYSVAIDGSGNIYLGGNFEATVDFDPSVGTDNHTSAGSYDAFLSKYASDGTYQWTKTIGEASSYDEYDDVAFDIDGNIYIVGVFHNTVDFDPSAGVDNKTSNGSMDTFLSKFSSDGTYQWTKIIGGSGLERPSNITLDNLDNIYTVGKFQNTVDFDPSAGTDNHTSAGSYDSYLSKYASDGTYQWTKTVGGTGFDTGNSIAIDSSGNIYQSGYFAGTVDFDPSAGVDTKNETGDTGNGDTFLSKYASDGTYQWTNTVGGVGYDDNYGTHSLALDSNDNIYSVGLFDFTVDFDPSAGIDEHTSNGLSLYTNDVFLTSYSSDGTYRYTKTWGGTNYDEGIGIAIFNDTLSVTGNYSSSVDFDPSSGVDTHTNAGGYDIFLSSYTLPAVAEEDTSGDHNKYYKLYKQYKAEYKNPGSKKKHTELKLLKRTNLPEFERLKALYQQYHLSGATYRKTLPIQTQADYQSYRKYRGYKLYLYYKDKAGE